jgi:hypothetical protein
MSPLDRRRFVQLAAAGLVAGTGLVAGACDGSGPPEPEGRTPVTQADHLEGDLAIAALLASLENLLVVMYQEGLDRRERLGPFPPAVQAMFEHAQRQHREHANAWNGIITGAGKPGVTGVNLTVRATTADQQLNRARDSVGLLTLYHDIEGINAITYLDAVGALENNAAIKVAASIHPVENEHIAALTFLLGKNLATDGFGRVDGARRTTDAIG